MRRRRYTGGMSVMLALLLAVQGPVWAGHLRHHGKKDNRQYHKQSSHISDAERRRREALRAGRTSKRYQRFGAVKQREYGGPGQPSMPPRYPVPAPAKILHKKAIKIPKKSAIPQPPKKPAQGLTATYFDTVTLEGKATSWYDTQVNFQWAMRSPIPGRVKEDAFSVRWEGYLLPRKSGSHCFYIRSSDGIRLWIGDELVIDAWKRNRFRRRIKSVPVQLTAGEKYEVRLEFFDEKGWAGVAWYWREPGIRQSVKVVPPKVLRPVETPRHIRFPRISVPRPVRTQPPQLDPLGDPMD